MPYLVLTSLDLNGNQIKNFAVDVLPADPTGGGLYEGRFWFNSTTDTLKYYNGLVVVPLSVAGDIDSLTVDNVTIENISTAQDPNIRVKDDGITSIKIANNISLTKWLAPTADFGFGGFKLTGLATPVAGSDAATKAYVDAAAAGIDWKASVRAASTVNVATLSGFLTIDGVTLVNGDRVLIKNQSTGSQNGIYIVAASGWTRAPDADANAEVSSGLAAFVSEGTVNGNTGWVLTTDDPIVVDTTALVFTQFSGPGEYTAGAGLTLTGTQFALTIPVAVASGGTGATTAAAARTNLGAVTKVSFNWVSGTSMVCTHNLNTLDVIVQMYEVASGAQVLPDVTLTSVNAVTVSIAVTAGNNVYRVVVIG